MKQRIFISRFAGVGLGWDIWKEAWLIADCEKAFKIKTWYGGRWLSKKYYTYYEIKS